MRSRCNDPNNSNYKNYGGRGIGYCIKWADFWAFVEDMGERPEGYSIERLDPDGDYEPGNCVWASYTEQGQNRRNNKLTWALVDEIRECYNNGAYTYRSLSARYDVTYSTIRDIIKNRTWKR